MKRATFSTSLTTIAMALTAGLVFAACSTRQRQIEVANPTPGDKTPKVEEPEWKPVDENEEGFASVVTEIPQAELVKYLDPNAKLEYKFSYVSIDKTGSITFADNKARIEIADLPINQTGTMKMELFENGVAKLAGSKENVILKAGPNNLSLALKQVTPDTGTVGGTTAELVLSLEIIPDGTTVVTPGTGGAIKFEADILPLAKSNCVDCHTKLSIALPDNEAYYKSRGASLIGRLNKGAANTMPQKGSQEALKMSDADRTKLIDFIKSL